MKVVKSLISILILSIGIPLYLNAQEKVDPKIEAKIREYLTKIGSSSYNLEKELKARLIVIGRQVLPYLLKTLEDTDEKFYKDTPRGAIVYPSKIISILEVISALGDDKDLKKITEFTKYPNWNVRRAAIIALGKLRDDKFKPIFFEATSDKNPYVAMSAKVALKKLEEDTPQSLKDEISSYIESLSIEKTEERVTDSVISGRINSQIALSLIGEPAIASLREALKKAIDPVERKVHLRKTKRIRQRLANIWCEMGGLPYQGLIAQLASDKDSYSIGDKIFFELQLTNYSNTVIKVRLKDSIADIFEFFSSPQDRLKKESYKVFKPTVFELNPAETILKIYEAKIEKDKIVYTDKSSTTIKTPGDFMVHPKIISQGKKDEFYGKIFANSLKVAIGREGTLPYKNTIEMVKTIKKEIPVDRDPSIKIRLQAKRFLISMEEESIENHTVAKTGLCEMGSFAIHNTERSFNYAATHSQKADAEALLVAISRCAILSQLEIKRLLNIIQNSTADDVVRSAQDEIASIGKDVIPIVIYYFNISNSPNKAKLLVPIGKIVLDCFQRCEIVGKTRLVDEDIKKFIKFFKSLKGDSDIEVRAQSVVILACFEDKELICDHLKEIIGIKVVTEVEKIKVAGKTRDLPKKVEKNIVPDKSPYVVVMASIGLTRLREDCGVSVLIDNMNVDDLRARKLAVGALRTITGKNFGFIPDDEKPEQRVLAQRAWKNWWWQRHEKLDWERVDLKKLEFFLVENEYFPRKYKKIQAVPWQKTWQERVKELQEKLKKKEKTP